MKTKKLILTAAMLLMSVCTFAQSGTPLKGDVNGDGKVDVADIVAVIEIMKNGGGTAGETRYYWYCGQDHPSENSTIVTDLNSPGWRFTGTSLDTDYTFVTTENTIGDTPLRAETWYIALPVETQYHLYDDIDIISDADFITNETVTFEGVTYNIYNIGVSPRLSGITIKK